MHARTRRIAGPSHSATQVASRIRTRAQHRAQAARAQALIDSMTDDEFTAVLENPAIYLDLPTLPSEIADASLVVTSVQKTCSIVQQELPEPARRKRPTEKTKMNAGVAVCKWYQDIAMPKKAKIVLGLDSVNASYMNSNVIADQSTISSRLVNSRLSFPRLDSSSVLYDEKTLKKRKLNIEDQKDYQECGLEISDLKHIRWRQDHSDRATFDGPMSRMIEEEKLNADIKTMSSDLFRTGLDTDDCNLSLTSESRLSHLSKMQRILSDLWVTPMNKVCSIEWIGRSWHADVELSSLVSEHDQYASSSTSPNFASVLSCCRGYSEDHSLAFCKDDNQTRIRTDSSSSNKPDFADTNVENRNSFHAEEIKLSSTSQMRDVDEDISGILAHLYGEEHEDTDTGRSSSLDGYIQPPHSHHHHHSTTRTKAELKQSSYEAEMWDHLGLVSSPLSFNLPARYVPAYALARRHLRLC